MFGNRSIEDVARRQLQRIDKIDEVADEMRRRELAAGDSGLRNLALLPRYIGGIARMATVVPGALLDRGLIREAFADDSRPGESVNDFLLRQVCGIDIQHTTEG
jgi:hypothetical protein